MALQELLVAQGKMILEKTKTKSRDTVPLPSAF
jgi:hypothetical protein